MQSTIYFWYPPHLFIKGDFNGVSHLDPVRGHKAEHGGSVPALLVTDDLRVVVIRPRGDGGLGSGGLGGGGLGDGGLGGGGLGG